MVSDTNFPYRIAAFGERNFGTQYRQGNRVYSSDYIACTLMAQPIGNVGGFSNLYLVIDDGNMFVRYTKSE